MGGSSVNGEGMNMGKVEFGSSEWLEIADRYLNETVPSQGRELEGVKWTLCEIVDDAPQHLTAEGVSYIAWWYEFDGASVRFGPGILDEADATIRGDYQTILPMARTVYSDNPELLAQRRKERQEAAERGEVPALNIPERLAPVLVGLHDYLARHTQ
jgi:hypothetical protein